MTTAAWRSRCLRENTKPLRSVTLRPRVSDGCAFFPSRRSSTEEALTDYDSPLHVMNVSPLIKTLKRNLKIRRQTMHARPHHGQAQFERKVSFFRCTARKIELLEFGAGIRSRQPTADYPASTRRSCRGCVASWRDWYPKRPDSNDEPSRSNIWPTPCGLKTSRRRQIPVRVVTTRTRCVRFWTHLQG